MGDGKCCARCMKRMKVASRRLGLLLWKNYVLRKGQICCTVVEIIFPFLLLLLPLSICYMAGMGGGGYGALQRTTWAATSSHARPARLSESELLDWAGRALKGSSGGGRGGGGLRRRRRQYNNDDLDSAWDQGTGPNGNYVSSEGAIVYTPFTPFTERVIEAALAGIKLDIHSEGFSSPSMIEGMAKNDMNLSGSQSQAGLEPRSTGTPRLKAAVIFDTTTAHHDLSQRFKKGHVFSYTIRLTGTGTSGMLGASGPPPEELTTHLYLPGNTVKGVGEHAEKYARIGFAGLQLAIDRAIMEVAGIKETPAFPPDKFKLTLESFPYNGELEFSAFYNGLIPILLIFGTLPSLIYAIKNLVSEKASGIRELMKMMGLPTWLHWTAWAVSSMMVNLVATLLVILVLFVPIAQGGGLINLSDPSVWILVWILFGLATCAYAFFISSIFDNALVGALVGFFSWLVIYLVLLFTCAWEGHVASFTLRMVTSLFPPMAFHWTLKTLSSLDGLAMIAYLNPVTNDMPATGGYWANFAEPVEDISLAFNCLMLLVDTVMYIGLTIYLENILPTKYGIRRPFYYMFQPLGRLLKRMCSTRVMTIDTFVPEPVEELGFEPEPADLVAGIVVENLTKKFGNKVAVKGISFKMYDGQITCLLGHNGAGKTTAMSMLTGIFAPTSGTAFINGHDIGIDIDEIRSSMGLCPQENMLFERLSVQHHFVFFGVLKGLTFAQARAETSLLMEKLRLTDKATTKSKALSGGQKRKVCLGMAMIGGTKLLVLDEPSSGMDPENRRAVWDLLQEFREGRTILLTTHFMEEADALGDRVIIMAEGQVKCCGTPMFLKKTYGTGYTLKLTRTGADGDPGLLLELVQKHIPTAEFKDQKLANAAEVAIGIPSENNVNASFPKLFTELSQRKKELNIETIGLQLSSMDEVFLKVGELSRVESGKEAEDWKRDGGRMFPNKLQGARLACQRFTGLLIKRARYNFLKPYMLLLFQMLIPLFLLWLSMFIFDSLFERKTSPPALTMRLSDYGSPVTYYSFLDKDLGRRYGRIAGPTAVDLGAGSVELKVKGLRLARDYRWNYIVGAKEMAGDRITAYFSPFALHSAPLSINLVSNAVLDKMFPGMEYRIQAGTQPIKVYAGSTGTPSINTTIMKNVGSFIFGFFFLIGFSLFAATVVIFPLYERLCKAKQLQLMTGVSPLIYWGSSYLWDMGIVVVFGVLAVCVHVIFQGIYESANFSAYNGLGVFFLIILISGFGAVSFSYVWSLWAATVAGGFTSLLFVHIVFVPLLMTGLWLFLLVLAFVVTQSALLFNITFWFELLGIFVSPVYGTYVALKYFVILAPNNQFCVDLMGGRDCDPNMANRFCCSNCDPVANYPNGCFRTSYFAIYTLEPIPFGPGPPTTMTLPGLLLVLLVTLTVSVIYTVIFLLSEYRAVSRLVTTIEQGGQETPIQTQNPALAPAQFTAPPQSTVPTVYQTPIQSQTALGAPESPVPGQTAPAFQPQGPNPNYGQAPMASLAGSQSGQGQGMPPPGYQSGQAPGVGSAAYQAGQGQGMPPQGYQTGQRQGMPPQGYQAGQRQGMPPQGYQGGQAPGMPPQGYQGGQALGMPQQGYQGGQAPGMQPQGYQGGQGQGMGQSDAMNQNQQQILLENQIRKTRITEPDVVAEQDRVADLVETGQTNQDAIVVSQLSKEFGGLAAVSNLSFGVHYGECFGLLGVNGAGKTTAFRILTGDEYATSGTAFNRGFSIQNDPRKFLKNIGYCPQFDAFFDCFTGKQMMTLYARLRGIPGSEAVNYEVSRWLAQFGLTEAANVKARNYSGGMKRRLSAALALIGDPHVILFDEPTSGVDPIAQHQFWDIILSLKGSDQAVVLTSHSMGECEALCSRLGIMVNGQFQCFGGAEHLKTKFGEGYTLFIKLKASTNYDLIVDLRNEINSKFFPCLLKEQHQNVIQYQVLNTTMGWGEIFEYTEDLATKYAEVVEEYSVNETTLEEVFLNFARQQYGERTAISKCTCRKCIMCECKSFE